jgi:copper transport protein
MTRRASALLAALVILVLGQLFTASPAAAHAELISTTPSNGEQRANPPAQVTLEFSESVGLLDSGIRLLDADGQTVKTADPFTDGSFVRWDMPQDLPDGAYVVNWRVVSGDSHPVAGAFSFSVGYAVAAPVVADRPATFDAPWPVMAARFSGYLGFTIIAGVAAFALFCWPQSRNHTPTQTLLRVGFTVAGLSTVAALLLQGPYAAGQPLTELFDRTLIAETSHSDFGAWTQIRFFTVLAMAAVLWPKGALQPTLNRWIAGGGVVALAATFSGTSHAAASGTITERLVDSTHVLTAGIWAGGLIALATASMTRAEKPGPRAFTAFSRLAMWSVLILVATGTVNAWYRLDTIDALWRSDYGLLLSLKLVIVAIALGAAVYSRHRLQRGTEPWPTVRIEAVATAIVLAVTGVLASVSPPTRAAQTQDSAQVPSSRIITMPLTDGRYAEARVGAGTARGTAISVSLLDSEGPWLDVLRVQMRASLPTKDVGPLAVTLRQQNASTWLGTFKFPYPGTWQLTLTVEDQQQSAVVATGNVKIP